MKTIYPISSLAEMNNLAAKIACDLKAGTVIRLDGTLGAGKTHFVKALAAALGYTDAVSSPTFPIVHEYRWEDRVLIHIDFYRLKSEEEIYAAGLDEYLPGEGITVVEWASRFPEVFPANTWQIEILLVGETSREVHVASPDY